eukprot:COSAG01_NODE_57023_length_315_cov_0.476852_2_plen_36_part_01
MEPEPQVGMMEPEPQIGMMERGLQIVPWSEEGVASM